MNTTLNIEEKLQELKESMRPQMQVEVVKDPYIGRRVRFNVITRKGFNSTQEKRHKSAVELAEIVINSLEFKDKVTSKHTFTSSTSNGEQVYNKLIAGAEVLSPEVDYELDVSVTMYESNNSTVGYTYVNQAMLWVNNKFFKNYTLGEIAGNLVHEYMHKLGYGHTANSTPARPQSVPYWIGYLVRDMVDDYDKRGVRYTDIYPVVIDSPNPELPPVVIEVPEKRKVCGWTWRFWLGKVCWYE